MSKKVTKEDLELLGELGVEVDQEKVGGLDARSQRIIAGFKEIERFVEEHGREPQHGEQRDIFERLYAVRLERIRLSSECRDVLKGRDSKGLLRNVATEGGLAVKECTADYGSKGPSQDEPSDEELLSQLGVSAVGSNDDILDLKHVRSREEIRAAEEVAQREACPDFDTFRPMFEKVQSDLLSGLRQTLKYQENAEVKKGDLFILNGQKACVAEMGEPFVSEYGRPDRRLRVVYDNGTESALLLRSLQRALNKDKASRRITQPSHGPLFADEEADGDLLTGYIYVLRSTSEHPFVAQNRLVLHKIGVTRGDIKARVANAKRDPTYLLADVEIVATFKLANINRKRLEALIHRFFGSARLDLELKDRFGFEVTPREWFLLPFPVIEHAVKLLMDGTIGNYRYDLETAQIVPL